MKIRAVFLMLSVLSIAVSAGAYTYDDDNNKKKREETEDQEETEIPKSVPGSLTPPPSIIPDTPTSPQAQAFARLGEYTMNNSSGIPDIGLPLFQLDFYGYTIPLNLRYEAQPLKPGYNYDVFGLGWTLSGNSCVSRVIYDRADEEGYFGNQFELDNFENNDHSLKLFKHYASALEELNFQYDSYNVTLPSGRNIPFFMYKQGGILKFHMLPSDENVQIRCNYTTFSINSFVVTDEDGVTYTFNIADKANNAYLGGPNYDSNVAWMLSSINIPHKGNIYYTYNDLISFDAYTTSEPTLRISHYYSNLGEMEQPYLFNINMVNPCCVYKMRFLREITYGTSNVKFNYQSDGRHISSMVISDNGTDVKEFNFDVSNSKLNALTIKGSNNTDKYIYKFGYTSNNPGTQVDHWGNLGTSSTGQDIGNFNIFVGKDQTSVEQFDISLHQIGDRVRRISPKPSDLQCFYKIKLQSSTTGDSRISTPPDRHCVLSSITYPNGGYTTFEYENHRFLTATASDGDFVHNRRQQRIIQGGGFRIKSVRNYTAKGVLSNQDEYRYGFTYRHIDERHFPFPMPSSYNGYDHIGCGEAVVDPNMLTYLSYDYSSCRIPNGFMQMLLGIHVNGYPSFEDFPIGDGGAWWWEARFSAYNFRRLLRGRRAVVYPEITIYHGNPDSADGCMSKTVYKYDIYDYTLNSSRYYLCRYGQNVVPDTAYFEPVQYANGSTGPLLVCEEHPAKRDQLKSKEEYGKTGNGRYDWSLNSKEVYSYVEDQLQVSGWTYNSTKSRGHCGGIHTMSYGEGRNDSYIYLSEFYTQTKQMIGKSLLSQKTLFEYFPSASTPVTTSEHYSYTFGEKLLTKEYWDEFNMTDTYGYAGNFTAGANPAISSLINRHILTAVLSGTTDAYTFGHSSPVSGFKVDYGFFNNDSTALPNKLYERNGNTFEESVEILSYTSHGNPQETVNIKTGIHTAYIWGYNDRYLVIKAENATYNQLSSALGSLPLGNNLTIEQLDNVRSALPSAIIQTWTYSPLIGVAAMTDATGQTFTYQYDGLGRVISDCRVVRGRTEKLHDYTYDYKN